MAIAPTFRPDNKMLGGAVSDFSLFGGQTDPAGAVATTKPLPDPSAITIATDHAEQADSAGAAPTSIDVDSSPATTPGIAAVAASTAAIGHSALGSDGGTPGSVADHLAPVTTGSTTGSSTPPTILAAAPATHGAIAEHAPTVDPTTSALHDTTALVTDQITSGLTGALPSTGSVLIGDGVSLGATAVTSTLQILDGTGPTLHDATAPLASTLHGVGTDAAHTLDGITGGDPTGGITTLVGLVSTSELFSIGHADSGTTATASSGSIVDDLIGDHLATPILGDTDHGHDLIHGLGHDLDHAVSAL